MSAFERVLMQFFDRPEGILGRLGGQPNRCSFQAPSLLHWTLRRVYPFDHTSRITDRFAPYPPRFQRATLTFRFVCLEPPRSAVLLDNRTSPIASISAGKHIHGLMLDLVTEM